jgi:hypothetical protein
VPPRVRVPLRLESQNPAANSSMAPTAAAIPIPALAPVLRPPAGIGVGVGDDEAVVDVAAAVEVEVPAWDEEMVGLVVVDDTALLEPLDADPSVTMKPRLYIPQVPLSAEYDGGSPRCGLRRKTNRLSVARRLEFNWTSQE